MPKKLLAILLIFLCCAKKETPLHLTIKSCNLDSLEVLVLAKCDKCHGYGKVQESYYESGEGTTRCYSNYDKDKSTESQYGNAIGNSNCSVNSVYDQFQFLFYL